MSFTLTQKFVDQHGIRGLEQLRDMLNNGAPLREISDVFGLPVPTASRLARSLFRKKYILRRESEHYLRFLDAVKADEREIRMNLIQGKDVVHEEHL